LYGEYYGEQLGTQLTTKSGTDTRQVDVTINEEAIVVTVIQQSMFIDVEALIRGDVVQREGSFKSQYSFDPRTGRTLDMQVTFLPLESVAE
jgi:hypothetical protein